MSEKELLIALEEPLNRLHSGVRAMELMVLGMSRANDPYVDGFQAIWDYLQSAEAEIREVLVPDGNQHTKLL